MISTISFLLGICVGIGILLPYVFQLARERNQWAALTRMHAEALRAADAQRYSRQPVSVWPEELEVR